jgi:hypothetical protein
MGPLDWLKTTAVANSTRMVLIFRVTHWVVWFIQTVV